MTDECLEGSSTTCFNIEFSLHHSPFDTSGNHMKGIVFTEFLQLVEEKFGYETVDKVLLQVKPENDGAYTAVGTYDHKELIRLVVALSQEVNVAVPDLVKAFGRYLFTKFSTAYSDQISGMKNSFDLLEQVESYIHVEVRKLYPGAELPTFEHERPNNETLHIIYKSTRPFADLCEGLIGEGVSHFGESISIKREDLTDDGTSAKFTLIKQPVGSEVQQAIA